MLGERLGNVLFILTSISEERDKVMQVVTI